MENGIYCSCEVLTAGQITPVSFSFVYVCVMGWGGGEDKQKPTEPSGECRVDGPEPGWFASPLKRSQ